MDLKTPMLIIQGESDEYGGLEVKENYNFSPNIELFFVDTNHDFLISNSDWERVLSKIDEIIN
jgi:predicted alpha/beta-hydrolase family hydrolase